MFDTSTTAPVDPNNMDAIRVYDREIIATLIPLSGFEMVSNPYIAYSP